MERLTRLPTWPLTALLSLLWVLGDPPTPDLAAHEYRAALAAHAPFAIWEQGWYAGHALPGYSVLMPPLAALLSPQIVAAAGVVLAAWCFERLARAHWDEPQASLAALWFAIGVTSTLLGGQLAFAAGLGPGLAALVVARRRRPAAAGLAVVTTLTSPVAAAFLVLAAAAWWLPARARGAVWVAAGAIAPGLLIVLAFPQSGVQPFAVSSFAWCFAIAVILVVILPRAERELRTGAALYAAALVAGLVLDTALGGNLVRLAAVFAGPVAVGALWNRRMTALALIALPLLYWQWLAPVRSVIRGAGDDSSELEYYRPLIGELDRLAAGEGPSRIEVPFTGNHWETRFLPPAHPLARGWERQLDTTLNPIFYDGTAFSGARYRRWLDSLSVRYIALPDIKLDPAGAHEAQLVRRGRVPGLREIWRGGHWRLFRLAGARPLATPPVRVTALGPDTVTLTTPRAATSIVRVRFTPYWALTSGAGCVGRAPGGWTRVRLAQPGQAVLGIRFALGRIRATSDRCT
ncbi:MAG TPA: hypothetical protein VII98_02470 [Solirubrobacteraceae bacterium]